MKFKPVVFILLFLCNFNLAFSSQETTKAVFKLSEKYGGQISNIFWQVKNGTTTITGKENNIEIDWNNLLGEHVVIEAFIQLGENSCITYRQLHIEPLLRFVIDPVYTSKIISISSSNESPTKKYFPIETPVALKFEAHGAMGVSPDFNSFQWSIKKTGIGDNNTERADQTNKTEKLTHTFLETGLYNISVKAFAPNDETTLTDVQLLIGRCEGDDLDDIEILFNIDSIGLQTPTKGFSNSEPIWNYIRLSDTDLNVDITTLATDNNLFGGYGGYVYKYKRSSSSKFIDIDIQNANECFLDIEPTGIETCIECTPTATNCVSGCSITSYKIRDNLSPLPSCSGNALDMSALDTDTTKCTDDIFVVTASKEGRGREYKLQRTFYKHCPANEDYCYFGDERDRPSDHNCPSS